MGRGRPQAATARHDDPIMLADVGLLQWLTRLGNRGSWFAFTLVFVVRAAGLLAVLPRFADRDLH